MDCRACHASGSGAAAKPAAGWVYDCDSDRDYKLNILRLHDDRQASDPAYVNALALAGYDAAGLYATAATDGTSVLCARCHASNALPGTGYAGLKPLTEALHGYHATVTDPSTGLILDAATDRAACYRCHPGSETRCLRGAMGSAVAPDGSLAIQCQDCHGTMSAVGASGPTGMAGGASLPELPHGHGHEQQRADPLHQRVRYERPAPHRGKPDFRDEPRHPGARASRSTDSRRATETCSARHATARPTPSTRAPTATTISRALTFRVTSGLSSNA